MTTLARKLRAVDYFTLGWGTMVGVGWLVVMDDWLLRGGALGTVLGFLLGGLLLLPVGWVYGKLVMAMPDGIEMSLITTAPQPRYIVRPGTDRNAIIQGVDRIPGSLVR